MALNPSQVYLYAADPPDYQIALGAAAISGIPWEQVMGNFYDAWNTVANGSYLVIAVGAPANNALYYNPCGWPNPSHEAQGSTPFDLAPSPADTLPGRNWYESAAGEFGYQTFLIAAAFAYYATHGSLPSTLSSYPSPISPLHVCDGSLVVAFPSISSCVNGVDSATNLGPVATCLKSHGYDFVARYLGGPCFAGTPLTRSEIQQLTSAGLLVASIYSGANGTSLVNCGTQDLTQGQLDGNSAATLARAIGQPAGTAIYLGMESDQTHPSWLAYVQGWTQAVAAQGYMPGVYSSQSQLTTIHEQPWGLSHLLYWLAQWTHPGAITPAPCPSTMLSYARMWQYVGNSSMCNTAIDVNSAQGTVGMWS
ncbi:MAG: hypothetical protein C7B43_13195 [Sulfobacillus benefaciens]|jgi:hypothetical protein|uniref:Rv2525c-like glycoside hydrolase-like domain-containing protein n=1 Tax=Sulfobacillus benefaciens TaxID=453960 RepID=A0A2T2WWW5_9FIRM|nr:MAG: hypothetical protein C7B43_13195 [Sulfobacillus benefaciens]